MGSSILLSVTFLSWLLMFSCFFSLFFFTPLYVRFEKLASTIGNRLASRFCPRIYCLVLFCKNRRRLLEWYTELLSRSKGQTIVLHRLGAPRTIVTANPDNVEYVLKTNFANFPKGKPFTDLLGDFLGLGIFNVDGERWSVQRKLANHEFGTKCLREFMVTVLEDEVQTRLIPILEEAAENGGILDMQEVLKRFGFDTICRLTLGMDPRCLDLSQAPPPLAVAFDAASLNSALRGAAPIHLIWKLKRLFNVGSERDLKEAVDLVHGCVDEMIQARKNGGSGGDFLSRFLEAGLDGEQLRDIAISFLMAGRDTTSSALTWLFWLLAGHRGVEKQALDEIAARKTGAGKLGFDDLKEMNFIKACLCESMRLYPPAAWDSKHAAKDDVLPDGTAVYRGNRVTYFQYGMGRMEELWGEDRLEFKPARWFDEDGSFKMVSPYKYPIFQAGPRVCLGKEMAFIQMKFVVASVLNRFELTPARSDSPVLVPLLTACMAGGFNVRVRRR